jgi:hypothetical protein
MNVGAEWRDGTLYLRTYEVDYSITIILSDSNAPQHMPTFGDVAAYKEEENERQT